MCVYMYPTVAAIVLCVKVYNADGVGVWKQITRLVDVQKALSSTEGRVRFNELRKRASASCSLKEYSLLELEGEFGEPIFGLFSGSSLETAIKVRIASST